MTRGERSAVPLVRDDQHPDYHPGDRFAPESPKDEARVVAVGRAARTPFILVGATYVLVLAVAALVVGVIVLVMWLA
jgi:hypothetical protein